MVEWALNEEENVAAYVDRAGELLHRVASDFELILIDDGSTDDTWSIVLDLQRGRPWLKPYRNEGNRGSGYNTKRAIGLATKDYVFWQTVDWAYDITCLVASMWQLDEVDVLQGVRPRTSLVDTIRGRSDNWRKAVVSLGNYYLVRLLFRLPISDYQNVTVYPSRLLQSITLESESAFTNVELLLKTYWLGTRFKEVPAPFIKRQTGKGTGTRPRELFAAMRDILTWWTQWMLLGRRTSVRRGTV